MGLSSKQVTGDGLDWSQTLLQAHTLELPRPPVIRRQQEQNQLQFELLKCPRCESTNTKFCYYNNYNKSQPRHFCKTCKRHWTKGGTLRNVPVGGGRKNKKQKTSKTSSNTTNSSSTVSTAAPCNNNNMINRVNPQLAIPAQQQKLNHPDLVHGGQRNFSETLYQAMINPPSSVLQQNSISCDNLDTKSFNINNNGVLSGSSVSIPQNQGLLFPYSSYFDTLPSSICTSFQPSNVYNQTGESMEDSTITTIMPSTSSSITQSLQVPNTSSGMDMTNYWNWDDIENFVSADLNVPWDDSEIKP
ncbi:hypothetical protein DKX38_017061 [Salix brachista]|uniref:Dof zinc finger protein n=2 Tax=Salix TaxID=40685 RepID=A0A9Q0WN78_SALPP|nr:hypothetical protein DKX38_017061 [Salix brachista]KAJ6769788.1 hypothetical protein OIU79_020617 [Salix purpurea]